MTQVSTQATGIEYRVQRTGIASMSTPQSSTDPSPKVTDVGSASGARRRHPSATLDGAGRLGLGDDAGVNPSWGNNPTRTPSPSGSILRGTPRATSRGFVDQGSEAPTDDWKQAMRDAISRLLTPIIERLSFLEHSQRRPRKPRGRRPDKTSSDSKSNHSVDEGAHFIMENDARYDQLGCALLQQQPDGDCLPVEFFIMGLAPEEETYCATEKDALGVVWGVTYLRYFLLGTWFRLLCDNSALTWVKPSNSTNQRLTGWRLRLAEFAYQIKHEPDKDHTLADAVSLLFRDGLDTTPLDDEVPALAGTTRAAQALAKRNRTGLGKMTLNDLIDAQAADEF